MAATSVPQRIRLGGVMRNSGIRPHCTSRVAPAPAMKMMAISCCASSALPPNLSMTRKPSAWPVAAWIDPEQKPKIMNGRMRGSRHDSRGVRPMAAACKAPPVAPPLIVGSLAGAPCGRPGVAAPMTPGKCVGSSSGSQRRTASSTKMAMTAKANNGPARPSAPMMNSGATAGPRMVPSPNAEDRVDSALVRSASLVRAAT